MGLPKGTVKGHILSMEKGPLRGMYRRGRIWWFKWGARGNTFRQSLKTDNEELAIQRALEIRGRPELSHSKEWEAEVKAWASLKLRMGEFRPQTAENRQQVLLAFGKAIKAGAVTQIVPQHVEEWHQALSVTPSTAESYLSYLSSFFSYLVEEGKIRSNPCKTVRRRKVRRAARRGFLEPDEVDKLIHGAPNDEMKFILLAGFDAGLRTAEIVEARPEWFDMKRGLLHVQRSATWEPKDREDRTIPLTDRFREFLEAFRQKPFMIAPKALPQRPARKGAKKRWRYRYDFRRPFKDYVAKMGHPDLTRHDMRRTFASLRVSAGVSIYKVAKWLGDGVSVVERHYGHLIPGDADVNRDR